MKHTQARLFTFQLLFLISISVSAQVVDYGFWSSVGLSKKIKNGISLSLEEEYRMRENISVMDKSMTTLDLSYKLCSFLKAGTSYTMINYNHPASSFNSSEYWELRHRYNFYLQGSYKFNRLELSLRERFQSTNRVGVSQTLTRANPKQLLRTKLDLSYNVKGLPLNPYAYCEWHQSLNNPMGNGLAEMRYSAGLEYDFTKKISLKGGYLYSSGTEDDVDQIGHIFNLGLNYNF